jgi:hypothetical protein
LNQFLKFLKKSAHKFKASAPSMDDAARRFQSATKPPSKSICPLGGYAPIAPMKRSFVKARGPDVKYISAA